MSPDMERWIEDRDRNGWTMPRATWWKKLPIIRHIRVWFLDMAIQRHNAFYRRMGLIPQQYDSWVLYGIWHGKER